MAKSILAIDQGTTSTRAIVFDRTGQPVASAQREFEQHYPKDGWVEHDPETIWQDTLAVCREALARAGLDAAAIAAIGITNQRETVVLWERAHRPAGASRHRLAGPAHRRSLREAGGGRPRGHGARAHRARDRPLLLGDQARLAARRGAGRARRGRARRAGLRHDRQLSALAADRRARCTRPTPATRRARCSSTSTARTGTTTCCGCSTSRARCCPRWWTAARCSARRRRSCSARRCRSPAWRATSRRRPSARPASARA